MIRVLASDFAITFTTAAPEGPPGTRVPQGEGLFDLPIGLAVAVFLSSGGHRSPAHGDGRTQAV